MRALAEPACTGCYTQEANGITSMRQQFNRDLVAHAHLLDVTTADGECPSAQPGHLDLRFSNLCNFRCRTCGPAYSSQWYEDARVLDPEHARKVPKAVMTWTGSEFRPWLEPLVDRLETVVFAGGEPLLQEEQYVVLKLLLERKRTDVFLLYITNFSTQSLGGNDALALWAEFAHVRVHASLDGSGARGEYIRKGMKWEEILANRRRLRERCPHVGVCVSATVSIFNVLHLPDFHRELLASGCIDSLADLRLNLLQTPEHYCASVLPAPLREKARLGLLAHITWLRTQPRSDALDACIASFAGVAHVLEVEDRSELLPEFIRVTQMLDQLRRERLADALLGIGLAHILNVRCGAAAGVSRRRFLTVSAKIGKRPAPIGLSKGP